MFLSINLNMIKLIASLCKYNYIFKSDIIIIIITPELKSPPPNCTTTHVGFVQINPTCKRLLSTDIQKKPQKNTNVNLQSRTCFLCVRVRSLFLSK